MGVKKRKTTASQETDFEPATKVYSSSVNSWFGPKRLFIVISLAVVAVSFYYYKNIYLPYRIAKKSYLPPLNPSYDRVSSLFGYCYCCRLLDSAED